MNVGLTLRRERLAVCRLPGEASVPAWAWPGPFLSLTRAGAELSIVCVESAVPEGVRAERGWRCLSVDGTLDLALTGVLASLAGPLAEAGVPVFVVSTFDTDHVLVRETQLEAAVAALRRAGHAVSA